MSVEAQEIACQEGYIGVLTLNSPGTLNALSEHMIQRTQEILDLWAEDERICIVVIQGAGDRAFCAGGDIRELYNGIVTSEAPDRSIKVFSLEYRMDYTLHRFPKPVLGIAHGVLMGGGLGLFSGCRYRLVTPDVTLAMPEITIGLFPDVGASWFLNRMPGRLGLFMGLTGARLNASDALRVGLADMAILPEDRGRLLDRLASERWTGQTAADDNRLFRLLNQIQAPDYRVLPPSHLAKHEQRIARLSAGDELQDVVDQLLSAEVDCHWWHACMNTLKAGCPVSAWLVWTQLKKAQQMSLKAVFRMELAMASECIRRPDLKEGIRALAIDKDGQPAWRYSSIAQVPEDVVAAHFMPEWDDETDPMALE